MQAWFETGSETEAERLLSTSSVNKRTSRGFKLLAEAYPDDYCSETQAARLSSGQSRHIRLVLEPIDSSGIPALSHTNFDEW